MSETVRPTKKQRVLLDFIEKFIGEYGYSPSYREIMNGCDYNSIATVAVHINNLINRGHLRKRDHSARSLELTAGTGNNAGADQATASRDGSGRLQAAEAISDVAGRWWLLEYADKKLQEVESSGSSEAEPVAEGKAGAIKSEVKAQVAYNEAQTLMATLRIMQDSSIDRSSGQTDAIEARMQELTSRLRNLEDELSADGESA